MSEQEKMLMSLEAFWCQRMTELHEQGEIDNASALFSEFVVGEEDPFLDDKTNSNWAFLQVI